MALTVGIFAILAVQSLRSEETGGRAEPVPATPVSRPAWLGSHVAVAAIGIVVVLALTGSAISPVTMAAPLVIPSLLAVAAAAIGLLTIRRRNINTTWSGWNSRLRSALVGP